jgi:hypothetical protein
MMLTANTSRLALILAAWVLFPLAACGRSQEAPGQSVADAARQARTEKKSAKSSSTRASKVITDDDLSSRSKPSDAVNVGAAPKLETQPPSKSAVAAVEAADQAAESGGAKKGEDPEITKAKEQVAKAAKELDLLQRELALDQDTFYSNADYAHDKAGQTKLADEQQQINAKQQELSELKAHLQELEARKKATGSQSSTSASAPPQR